MEGFRKKVFLHKLANQSDGLNNYGEFEKRYFKGLGTHKKIIDAAYNMEQKGASPDLQGRIDYLSSEFPRELHRRYQIDPEFRRKFDQTAKEWESFDKEHETYRRMTARKNPRLSANIGIGIGPILGAGAGYALYRGSPRKRDIVKGLLGGSVLGAGAGIYAGDTIDRLLNRRKMKRGTKVFEQQFGREKPRVSARPSLNLTDLVNEMQK